MLHAARGIVFHTIRYAESSLVAKIYTDTFGLQSYLIRGVHRQGSKFRPALLQPMNLLDMVVYHRERHTLQSVKEIRMAYPFREIPFDIRKSSVSVFLNELVYKAIREEEANPALFEFLWNSMLTLDGTPSSVSMFHLRFMASLMHFLGCFPQCNFSDAATIFDLREGLFQPRIPDHPQYLAVDDSRLLSRLLNQQHSGKVIAVSFAGEQDETSGWPPSQRTRLLEILMIYYRLHLPWFREMQSHYVLHSVLS